MNATVRTTVGIVSGERRVFIETPPNGFGLEELDALQVGIEYARRELLRSCVVSEQQLPPQPCG